MRNLLFTIVVLFLANLTSAQKYLGQTLPGKKPVIFMPGEVSKKGVVDFGSVFSKDGREFFYATEPGGKAEIRYSKLVNGKWTSFKTILSHPNWGYNDPFLSNDETKLFYISRKPGTTGGTDRDYDIWYSIKEKQGWSAPINAGTEINSDKNEYYISFTHDGSMYFSSNRNAAQENNFDIYRAQFKGNGWETPVKLSEQVNTNGYEADVFVSPDESYLIFSSRGRNDSRGGIDLYISFKNADGNWSKAKNMGDTINTPGPEYCPFVTKDGKYLFYTSQNDIYWVSTNLFLSDN